MAKPPPRLFVDTPLPGQGVLPLTREQAHYLGTVLRLGEGQPVLIFNGQDGEWQGRIAEVSRKGGLLANLEQVREQSNSPNVTLCFAPVKKGPTDLIVQKVTELGASALLPVMTQRTVASRTTPDRWAVIAQEAAEQSERLDVPTLMEPIKLPDLLAKLNGKQLLFCDEAGDDPEERWGGDNGRAGLPIATLSSVNDLRNGWFILIGPEGGFTPQEREMIRQTESTVAISLGPRILKAETAAIAALTLWQATLGDLT